MLDALQQLPSGVRVKDVEGKNCGKTQRIENDKLVIKIGWLFPAEYYIPMGDVRSVSNTEVLLSLTKGQVTHDDAYYYP